MREEEQIDNFDRIEAIVKSGDIESLPIAEIRKELSSLLSHTPTSRNPQFMQRWERVKIALQTRIENELPWWQKPIGILGIAIFAAIVSAAATKLLSLQ